MEVILYHQKGCGMCATVERMLKIKNIPYESVMDMQFMQELGITHTPTLCVDGQFLTGAAIRDWLSKQG